MLHLCRPRVRPRPHHKPRRQLDRPSGPRGWGSAWPVWALLLLTSTTPLPAAAAPPWDGPAFTAEPAEMLAAAERIPTPEDASVEVLLTETEMTVEADGLRHYRQKLVYRILEVDGPSAWSTVESPWSPWYQEKPEVHARVITADGRVHELDPSTLGETPGAQMDPEVFQDTRQLRAPLPAIQVGSLVESEVRVRHRQPYFAAGETRRHWLPMTVPVRQARVIVDTPADLELRIETGGFETADGPEPAVRRSGGRTRRIWVVENLEPLLYFEPGLPPEATYAPYLAFSTGSSWAEVAQAYSRIVDEQLGSSGDLDAELASFAGAEGDEGSPVTSQWERIQQLIAALHRQVRYTGVQFGDAGIVPRAPHETLERRFGDCKDKAVLLTALLRREGIPAYLALLNTGPGPDALEDQPGLGLFDHAIVYVPGGSALWIDATDPYSPLGEIPSAVEDRWALVASPNTGGLIRTPASRPEDNLTHEVREIFLADVGTARVVETSEMRGDPAWEMRASWAGVAPEEIRTGLEDYMESTYGAAKLTRFEHTPTDELGRTFRVEIEAEEATHGVTDLYEAVAILGFSSMFERLPQAFFPAPDGEASNGADDETPREQDYVLRQPYRTRWEYRIHMPENLELRERPEDFEKRLGPAVFSQRFQLSEDGRTLTVDAVFDTGQRRFTPADLEAFHTALEELDDEGRGQTLVWFDQTVQARLADGGVAAAVEEARRLIRLQPEKALPRGLLSQVVLAGGLGEEARRIAEEAVRLEPDHAVSHQIRAWVLVHDPVGRQFHEGFDREGAAAAYRRALELDPEEDLLRTDYAILLEHDAQGRRYSDAADLEAAIDEYRQALETLDDAQVVDNLLIALMWAERFEELQTELERRGDTDDRAYLSLMATAELKGAEAALRAARRRFNDRNLRVQHLAGAARHLMLLGRYAAASELFRGAGRDGANAAALLGLAELMDRAAHQAETEGSAATPEGLVRSFFQAVLRPEGVDFEKLASLLAPSLREQLLAEETEEASPFLDEAVSQGLDDSGVPPQVLLDLIFASMEVSAAGESDSARELVVHMSFGPLSHETRLYVAPEGDELRLVAVEDHEEMLGLAAMTRLDEDDLEGARELLDLAYDALPSFGEEEPLIQPLIRRFWSPDRTDAGEDEMRLAAAALLADMDGSGAEAALPIFLAAAEDAPETERWKFDLALAEIYTQLERSAELRPVMERVVAAYPDSELAFLYLTSALFDLEDYEALERHIAERLERLPDDGPALNARLELHLARGDLEAAQRDAATLIEIPSPDPEYFNQAAWIKVMRGDADQQALRWARQGAERTSYQSYPVLHTLATVYAELGQAEEAYRVLLQGLEVSGRGLDAPDWYVLGRLAEIYGLPEPAEGYYRRLERPENERAVILSSWALAQQRLAALESGAS